MVTAAQLDVVIRAQDQSSRAINSVRKSVGGLESTIGGFGLSSAVAFGAATAALGAFAAMGLNEVRESEKVLAQTNAVLESTGSIAGVTAADIDRLATNLSNLSAVDDEVIQSASNVLLTFTNIRNSGVDKTFDAASLAALNLSVRMGTDLQSATVLVGKALQDPIQGMTALKKAGVQLSVVQKQQVRDFMAVGDIASAQKVILGELETQFGGAAEAAGSTFAGQMDLLQIKMENFSGEVMIHTIPALVALTGFAGDTITAIEKIGDVTEESRDSIFGFWEDLPGPIKNVAKGLAVVTAIIASPVIAVGAGAFYGITRAVDALSDETDAAALSADDFADSLEAAQGAAGQTQQAISQLGDVIRTATDMSNAGRGGEALAARVGVIETAWQDVTAAVEEADRAIFDALSQPSPERMQRDLALSQAKFNVSRLDQKAAQGPLSPENKSWYDYLVNTFIPAQEDWLSIDQQRVERDEKAAVLSESLTGNYRNLDAAIRGNLTPGFNQLGEAMYDVQDATYATTTALGLLEDESPVEVGITVEPPTEQTLREIIDAIDPTEQIHVGLRENGFTEGQTPNQIIQSGKYDPTERIKVGMVEKGFDELKGPNAIISSGKYDPTEKVKVGMVEKGFDELKGPNAIISSGKYDPTEKVKVGMVNKGFPEKKSPNDIIASGRYDPTEQVKVGMRNKGFPEGKTPNEIIAEGTYDPTEQVKVGMRNKGFDEGKSPNAIIAAGTYDPTEQVKVGMRDKGFAEGLSPNAIIAAGTYDPTERVKVGMYDRGFDKGQTPNEIIARGTYDPTEKVKVGMYTDSSYSVWKTIQDYFNGHSIFAGITAKIPDITPWGQSVPGGFVPTAGTSGGGVSGTFIINVYQANITTPTGANEVVGHLWRSIQQRIREG